MRHIILFAIAIALLGSCGKSKTQVKQLTGTVDSLTMEISSKDSIMNEAFLDIDEIASSLNQIAIRENLVSLDAQNSELAKSKRESIDDNIVAITTLIEKNRTAIARLSATTKKLADANIEVSGLKKLVASLQTQIEDKDKQITELSARLESMNIEITHLVQAISGLEGDKESLKGEVSAQTTRLNEVHYIVGNERELQDMDVIDKKGFLSRTTVVGTNLKELHKADIRELERISIGGKKIRVVTNHPEGSYMLVYSDKRNVEELVITDKNKFWSNSKILIVTYK